MENIDHNVQAHRKRLETFHAVNKNLKNIFSQLSPGGKAYMMLEREEDPFSGGVSLVVRPRGMEVLYLEAILFYKAFHLTHGLPIAHHVSFYVFSFQRQLFFTLGEKFSFKTL